MCIIIKNKFIELCFIELKFYIFLWTQRRKTVMEMLKSSFDEVLFDNVSCYSRHMR